MIHLLHLSRSVGKTSSSVELGHFKGWTFLFVARATEKNVFSIPRSVIEDGFMCLKDHGILKDMSTYIVNLKENHDDALWSKEHHHWGPGDSWLLVILIL